MKRKGKKIFLIAIIILIILIIVIYQYTKKVIDISNNNSNTTQDFPSDEITEKNIEGIDNYTSGMLTDTSIFFNIEDKVNNFYKLLKQKQINKAYNLLNKAYAENNQVNEQNLYEVMGIKESFIEFKANKIYKEVIQTDENFANLYHIDGYIYFDDEQMQKKNVYIVVAVDYIRKTYAIAHYGEISNNSNNFDEIVKEIIENPKNLESDNWEVEIDYMIEENDENEYSEELFSEFEILEKYFNRYIFYAQYDRQYILNYVSDGTKKSKFVTLEDFDKYILENNEKIKNTQIKAYKIDEFDDYVRYIVKDVYDTYYIFDVKSVNDYSIIIQ